MIKMIAVDMDGTFLDENGRYDIERFEKILEELEKREILFVVATGNQISRMRHIFGEQSDRLAYVVGNGSHVIVKNETKILKNLSEKQLEHLFAYYEHHFDDYHIVVSSPEHSYMTKGAFSCDNLADKASLDYYNNSFPNVILLDNMSEIPQEAINKITMKVPMSAEEKVTNDFRREFPDLVPMASGFGALDVVLPNIDKAWGLKQIMTLFDISPDELMAFGDGDNDLAMLSLAYHSYAMENATERVKETARFTAPANTKSGVFQVIEAYLKEN